MDCQVGALFAINDEVVRLECFGHWQTFSKFFQKLIQSYALDALEGLEEPKEKQVPAEAMRRFLDGVRKGPRKAYPSLGLGENIRLEGPFVLGAGLVHEGSVLHLSAFINPAQGNSGVRIPFEHFSQTGKR